MIFNIEFDERALKEWDKLDKTIQTLFKKKLKQLQNNPHIESARLHRDLANCYKIKLRSSGYRLVYQVIDGEIIILVIAVGKRENKKVYGTANTRLNNK
ncbi:mRNA-degrading endonuclease RelE [Commensalibacter communis]|uniref:type II toxin-antitoxin system RelE family toxin n=1 Tax=Commensalibacter communis TaxID=2972786 RepID=UPI0022FF6C12|nr:type II toxin-antitoxin system RelE/ParE family toxin [Commensalibacter communis]CAI3959543.1 mRNA-degrading endonuclease RelE [Commensalibacter communis]